MTNVAVICPAKLDIKNPTAESTSSSNQSIPMARTVGQVIGVLRTLNSSSSKAPISTRSTLSVSMLPASRARRNSPRETGLVTTMKMVRRSISRLSSPVERKMAKKHENEAHSAQADVDQHAVERENGDVGDERGGKQKQPGKEGQHQRYPVAASLSKTVVGDGPEGANHWISPPTVPCLASLSA